MAQLKIVPRLSIRTQARLAVAADRAEKNGRRPLTEKEIIKADELTTFERIGDRITIDHYEGWRRFLTWRYVFDSKAGRNLSGTGQQAREAGYRFFAFEGHIYFVSRRGLIEDTELTAVDIDQNGRYGE